MNPFHDSIAARHTELQDAGFVHVLNVADLNNEESFDFGGGIQIRPATTHEIESIQALLAASRPLQSLAPYRNPYETEVRSTERDGGAIDNVITLLPDDRWRYHVIAFQGPNTNSVHFCSASILTRSRILTGHTIFARTLNNDGKDTRHFGVSTNPGAVDRMYREAMLTDDAFMSLDRTRVKDLRHVCDSMAALEDDRAGIRSAIGQFAQLDLIPKFSPLRFLGYISLIEALVTHEPDPSDPHSSLTRQVRQKMLLIGRRAELPIPYDLLDTSVGKEKLWTKLYAYRSKIAHGATPDFKNKLKCLKSQDAALDFIKAATVTVMRQALEEPELIIDLRQC